MKNAVPDKKQIRTFGIGLTAVISIIAGLQIYWGRPEIGIGLFIACAIILILLIFTPTILIPLYKLVLRVSKWIGVVTTPVMLGLVFYLVFAPVGIVLRLIKRDILDKRFDVSCDSYWKAKEKALGGLDRYEQQY